MGDLSKRVLSVVLGALSSKAVCDHAPDKLTYVRGNLVHCKCGISRKADCTHVFVAKLMPRFYQCQDCMKNVTGDGG